MAISTVELSAYVIADVVNESFKGKRCTKLFLFSYTICFVGAIIIVSNDPEANPWLDLLG